jgi:OmpA-OmpF porin, OOP family
MGDGRVDKRFWFFAPAITLIGLLTGCAGQQMAPPESFRPVQPDSSAYSGKVDTFIVVFDTASSMESTYRKRVEADRAQAIVSRMNRMIPELDYRAALLAFESGSCLSCEDAAVLYGPAPYDREAFAAGLAAYSAAGRAGGPRPKSGGIAASRFILQGNPGRVALIIVSNSENILHGRAYKTVQKLKGILGGSLCIYPILMDRECDSRAVTEAIVDVAGCGFAVNVDDIATPDAMARYVEEIFLGPASRPVAAAPAEGLSDSDGDGVPDSRDRCPNTPRGAKVDADGCWNPNSVYFDSDQAVIRDTRLLDEVSAVLKANPTLTGEVEGHTDSTAAADYNQKLSEARAGAVRSYFILKGVAPERIRTKGFGETRPAASNATPEGRAMNRRVELRFDGR